MTLHSVAVREKNVLPYLTFILHRAIMPKTDEEE